MLQILGFTGDIRPYLPANDNTVTVLLVICFFIISLTLASNKKLFTELGAVFFNKKNKITNYRNAVSTNIISLSPLILQASLLMGVITYIFLKVNFNDNIVSYPPWQIIGITTVITLAYLAVKWAVYSFIGWVFDEKYRTGTWIEAYATLLYYAAVSLYLLVLFIVYSDIAVNTIIYIVLVLFLITKCLIFYKWLKLFSKKMSGLILLILYFCALEIIPYVILYKVMNKTIMF